MRASQNNFFLFLKGLIMGGGRDSSGNAVGDAGYLRVAEGVSLKSLRAAESLAALTDNTGGTVSTTLAAAAAKYTMTIAIPDMTKLVNSQVWQVAIPHAFTITSALFRTDVAITTGAKAVTFTTGVSGSAMTGGVIVVAGTYATGVATNSTSITALNTGTATNTVSFTTSSVTTFVEGEGHLSFTVVNNDLANSLSSLVSQHNQVTNAVTGTADETNALVLKTEETVDTIGVVAWTVPPDYDEATDILTVRVLASQLTVSTDNDVQLDANVYVKTAGSALGSDLNPTIPSTVLSTTEQWVSFDLKGNSLVRDQIVYFKLITDGHNDTNGEEVLIHDIQFKYRSTLVSYDETDGATNLTGNQLR